MLMHTSGRSPPVFFYGVCFDVSTLLTQALALARISTAERGCTFELMKLLPEPDITAQMMRRYMFGPTYGISGADEVERTNGRWRICKVDRSRNCAFVCQYDNETRTAEISFLPETMAMLRAGPILTTTLERPTNADYFRVGMEPGYIWPTWYNDGV